MKLRHLFCFCGDVKHHYLCLPMVLETVLNFSSFSRLHSGIPGLRAYYSREVVTVPPMWAPRNRITRIMASIKKASNSRCKIARIHHFQIASKLYEVSPLQLCGPNNTWLHQCNLARICGDFDVSLRWSSCC